MTEDSHIQSTEERAGSRLRQISFIFFSFFYFSSFVYGLFPYSFVSVSVSFFASARAPVAKDTCTIGSQGT